MVAVNHVRMAVAIAVRKALGAHQMGMIGGKRVVHMLQHLLIPRWPELDRHEDRNAGEGGHDQECRLHADRDAKPSGERIGNQPAGVRQGELGCKQGRPVFRLR